jgi:pSer/pThr/pTyr-binding forkhead associated (FHA) protein
MSNSEIKFALTSNAFAPIFVSPNTQYTVGRERDNSIVLIDDLVSRCHSAFILDPEGKAFIEDRGSKNGTILNGKRIKGRTPLNVNDKVTIGSYHIFYKSMASFKSEPAPGIQSTTVPIDELGDPEGMVGNLTHMNVTELLTTLEFHKKSGILTIVKQQEKGRVYFKLGNVVHCEFGVWEGLEAVNEVLALKEGIFEFEQKADVSTKTTIHITTQQIFLKYAQHLNR